MTNMSPGNAGFGRRLEAEQEALQRARLQTSPAPTDDLPTLPRNRVSAWFSDHPVSTVFLILLGGVTAFIVLLS